MSKILSSSFYVMGKALSGKLSCTWTRVVVGGALKVKLHLLKILDGSQDFTSFSTVFQSYQDNGRVVTKGSAVCNETLFYGCNAFCL